MSSATTTRPPLVVVSNRGKNVSKQTKAGETIFTRTGGGLVASIRPAIEGHKAMWIAGSVGEEPVPDAIFDDLSVHSVTIDEATYRKYYEIIANGTLWFLHHNLFDMARRPRIDRHWWEAWHSYCTVNEAFHRVHVASVTPEDAVVLVHDYHRPCWDRSSGPSIKTSAPSTFTTLRSQTATQFRSSPNRPSMCSSAAWPVTTHVAFIHSVGPTTSRCVVQTHWGAYRYILERSRSGRERAPQGAPNETATRHAGQQLENLTKGRKLIVRVDESNFPRTSYRGFYAFDELLREHPQMTQARTFVAQLYPSRETMAEYLAYRNELEGLVDHINSEWSTPEWLPIEMSIQDQLPPRRGPMPHGIRRAAGESDSRRTQSRRERGHDTQPARRIDRAEFARRDRGRNWPTAPSA